MKRIIFISTVIFAFAAFCVSTSVGFLADQETTRSYDNVLIGERAGYQTKDMSVSTGVGRRALQGAANSGNVVAIGDGAGSFVSNVYDSVYIGNNEGVGESLSETTSINKRQIFVSAANNGIFCINPTQETTITNTPLYYMNGELHLNAERVRVKSGSDLMSFWHKKPYAEYNESINPYISATKEVRLKSIPPDYWFPGGSNDANLIATNYLKEISVEVVSDNPYDWKHIRFYFTQANSDWAFYYTNEVFRPRPYPYEMKDSIEAKFCIADFQNIPQNTPSEYQHGMGLGSVRMTVREDYDLDCVMYIPIGRPVDESRASRIPYTVVTVERRIPLSQFGYEVKKIEEVISTKIVNGNSVTKDYPSNSVATTQAIYDADEGVKAELYSAIDETHNRIDDSNKNIAYNYNVSFSNTVAISAIENTDAETRSGRANFYSSTNDFVDVTLTADDWNGDVVYDANSGLYQYANSYDVTLSGTFQTLHPFSYSFKATNVTATNKFTWTTNVTLNVWEARFIDGKSVFIAGEEFTTNVTFRIERRGDDLGGGFRCVFSYPEIYHFYDEEDEIFLVEVQDAAAYISESMDNSYMRKKLTRAETPMDAQVSPSVVSSTKYVDDRMGGMSLKYENGEIAVYLGTTKLGTLNVNSAP